MALLDFMYAHASGRRLGRICSIGVGAALSLTACWNAESSGQGTFHSDTRTKPAALAIQPQSVVQPSPSSIEAPPKDLLEAINRARVASGKQVSPPLVLSPQAKRPMSPDEARNYFADAIKTAAKQPASASSVSPFGTASR